MSHQLVVRGPKGEKLYFLNKRIVLVGSESVHDVCIPASAPGVHFTLAREALPRGGEDEAAFELVPGLSRLKLNGEAVRKKTPLQPCDRLEWESHVAVYIAAAAGLGESPLPAAGGNPPSARPLEILHNLAQSLQSHADFESVFRQLLDSLVDISGAEDGSILSDLSDGRGWRMVASSAAEPGEGGDRIRQGLFSNHILNLAIAKREPLYIENVIGTPHADALSVIQARIFSIACFPLVVGDRVLGAVTLQTRTPGRFVRREPLLELSLLASQAALLMISSAELGRTRAENTGLKRRAPVAAGVGRHQESAFVYESPEMDGFVRKLAKLAPTGLPILIEGETGTGKEIAARELHRLSASATRPFIAVNCAAIPATLLEATLFGYERGAFTGAVKAQAGKFEQASGGTLFLDEIGDLSVELQAKLLRVLQEKVVEPLGASAPRPIEVRVLSATHRRIETLISKGLFRQDLYFRMAGARLELPALRARTGDLLPLARHFVRKAGSSLELSPEAEAIVLAHPWPGNVRELEQVMTRAALLAEGSAIEAIDLDLQQVTMPSDEDSLFWARFGTLGAAQLQFTRRFVEAALQKSQGNRAQAAQRLGISERTLYRILAEPSDSPDSTGSLI